MEYEAKTTALHRTGGRMPFETFGSTFTAHTKARMESAIIATATDPQIAVM